MTDDELASILLETIAGDEDTSLDDAFVNAFMERRSECDEEGVRQLRTRFITKLFAEVHANPVRDVDQHWTFGRWVEAIRESVRLTRADIADVISADVDLLRRLEQGDLLPWRLDMGRAATLVSVLRLHLDAVRQLVVRSEAVLHSRTPGTVAARAPLRGEHAARADAAQKALHSYLAANASANELGLEAQAWIESLRKHLLEHGPADLVTQ